MRNNWKIISGSLFKLSAKFYAKREMYVMFEAVKFIASNNLSDKKYGSKKSSVNSTTYPDSHRIMEC